MICVLCNKEINVGKEKTTMYAVEKRRCVLVHWACYTRQRREWKNARRDRIEKEGE